MSSTVSCSSAAHSVAVSRRMPAQILATPTGWVMKSSPDWRRWSAWCSQANRNASRTALRSIGSATSSACSETIANRSASSSCSSVVRSSGIASVPSSPCSARSTGRCAATATGAASPPVSGRSPFVAGVVAQAACGASDCCWSGIAVRPRAVAGRPRMPRSARARCAAGARPREGSGRRDRASASPSSVRTRTSRPASAADRRLRPVAAEQRLACLTAHHPRRAQGAVDERSAGRAGRSPIRVSVAAKSSSGAPHARWVQPSPSGWSSRCRVGGSTATTCGNGAREPRIVLERGPRGRPRTRPRGRPARARDAARGRSRRAPARRTRRGRRGCRRCRCRARIAA